MSPLRRFRANARSSRGRLAHSTKWRWVPAPLHLCVIRRQIIRVARRFGVRRCRAAFMVEPHRRNRARTPACPAGADVTLFLNHYVFSPLAPALPQAYTGSCELSSYGGEHDSTGLRAKQKLNTPLLRCASPRNTLCSAALPRRHSKIETGSRQAPRFHFIFGSSVFSKSARQQKNRGAAPLRPMPQCRFVPSGPPKATLQINFC